MCEERNRHTIRGRSAPGVAEQRMSAQALVAGSAADRSMFGTPFGPATGGPGFCPGPLSVRSPQVGWLSTSRRRTACRSPMPWCCCGSDGTGSVFCEGGSGRHYVSGNPPAPMLPGPGDRLSAEPLGPGSWRGRRPDRILPVILTPLAPEGWSELTVARGFPVASCTPPWATRATRTGPAQRLAVRAHGSPVRVGSPCPLRWRPAPVQG